MKKVFFALSLATLAVFTYSFVTPAATPIKEDIDDTYTTTFINPCTGEDVDLTYDGTISVRGVINNNRVNVTTQYNYQLSGEGQTSGATYVGHISEKFTENGSLNNGQFVFDVVVNANLNTSGGGNNVKETQTFHVTVNANGTVTVGRGESSAICQ
jgi:hypothetical protein